MYKGEFRLREAKSRIPENYIIIIKIDPVKCFLETHPSAQVWNSRLNFRESKLALPEHPKLRYHTPPHPNPIKGGSGPYKVPLIV